MIRKRKIKDFSDLSERQQRRRIAACTLENKNSKDTAVLENGKALSVLHINSDTSLDTGHENCEEWSEYDVLSDGTSSLSSSTTPNSNTFSTKHILPSLDDFEHRLRILILKYNVTHGFINELLPLLRDHGHEYLPNDVRTFMKTPLHTSNLISKIAGGEYIHFGLERMLIQSMVDHNYDPEHEAEKVFVNFNIDGLPISNSSAAQFWPVQGAIVKDTLCTQPFIVGIFYGVKKPSSSNEYLKQFCGEAKHLLENGFYFKGVHCCFKINAFICDAPARAFVTGVKNHNGYFGCSKCTTEGTFIDNRVTFPQTNSKLRTDNSFSKTDKDYQEEHHVYDSILQSLNIGMVSQVPIDYMHLVCLGVTKRLIQFWVKGKKNLRLSDAAIQAVNKRYLSVGQLMPCEFSRKPRSLCNIDRWKATELRFFLLYGGMVVLKDVLKKKYYEHFLCLSLAIRILSNLELIELYIDYAQELLVYFVRTYSTLYGQQFISYNVHNLIHVCNDVKRFGSLDNFSAFKYENHMYKIKKKIKACPNPLQQIYNRTVESNYIDQKRNCISYPLIVEKNEEINFVHFKTFKVSQKEPNNWCILQNGNVAMINRIFKNGSNVCASVNIYTDCKNFFVVPCESQNYNIFLLSTTKHVASVGVPLDDIKLKCVIFKISEDINVVLPILHNDK